MIEFILDVIVNEQEDPRMKYSRLYKKMQWPVLPREGEWFEIAETESSTATPISDVWHWVNEDGTPRIHVEMSITLSEYQTLEKSPLWKNRERDL